MQNKVKYRLEFANIQDGQADIRISFEPGKGNFSYVGMQNRAISAPLPTMNLELADGAMEEVLSGVILYEFSHAIGCVHGFLSTYEETIFLRQELVAGNWELQYSQPISVALYH